jgi:SAM-dependent methyltransferase
MNVVSRVFRATRRAYRGFARERSAGEAFAATRLRLLESSAYSPEEKEWLKQASMRVHHRDLMFKDDPAHYLSSGISGMRCIREVLRTVGWNWDDLAEILDFPCGYGRVLRFVRVACPNARITGCEIDREAVRFCERVYQAVPVVSRIPVSELVLEEKFDLIWCGSLLTHVDEEAALGFLKYFCGHLRDGGLCVFTTHGRVPVDWMRSGRVTYGLPEEARAAIIADYDAGGYGYADYPHAREYGISAACPERMRALAGQVSGWRECLFLDHGWDECQDVHAYVADGA